MNHKIKKSNSKEFLLKYAIVTVLVLVVFLLPENVLFNKDNTVCLHCRFLGIECPFCGLTRSAYEILHLRINNALKLNFNVLLIAAYFMLDILFYATHNQRVKYFRKIVAYMLIIGFVSIYVYRIVVGLNSASIF